MVTLADLIEELIMTHIKRAKEMQYSDRWDSLQNQIDLLKESINSLLGC